MFKTLLPIISILVSVSSYAFLPDVNTLSSTIQKKLQVKKGNLIQSDTQQCSQFSGSWVGTCENSKGDKKIDDLKITQDSCNSLTTFTKEISAETHSNKIDLTGGIKVETAATALVSINVSSAANWNSDRTVIQGVISGLVNSPLNPLPSILVMNYQVTLNKEQLFVYSQTTGLSLDQMETCIYNKK